MQKDENFDMENFNANFGITIPLIAYDQSKTNTFLDMTDHNTMGALMAFVECIYNTFTDEEISFNNMLHSDPTLNYTEIRLVYWKSDVDSGYTILVRTTQEDEVIQTYQLLLEKFNQYRGVLMCYHLTTGNMMENYADHRDNISLNFEDVFHPDVAKDAIQGELFSTYVFPRNAFQMNALRKLYFPWTNEDNEFERLVDEHLTLRAKRFKMNINENETRWPAELTGARYPCTRVPIQRIMEIAVDPTAPPQRGRGRPPKRKEFTDPIIDEFEIRKKESKSRRKVNDGIFPVDMTHECMMPLRDIVRLAHEMNREFIYDNKDDPCFEEKHRKRSDNMFNDFWKSTKTYKELPSSMQSFVNFIKENDISLKNRFRPNVNHYELSSGFILEFFGMLHQIIGLGDNSFEALLMWLSHMSCYSNEFTTKINIFMNGPQGIGKSYMMERVAELFPSNAFQFQSILGSEKSDFTYNNPDNFSSIARSEPPASYIMPFRKLSSTEKARFEGDKEKMSSCKSSYTVMGTNENEPDPLKRRRRLNITNEHHQQVNCCGNDPMQTTPAFRDRWVHVSKTVKRTRVNDMPRRKKFLKTMNDVGMNAEVFNEYVQKYARNHYVLYVFYRMFENFKCTVKGSTDHVAHMILTTLLDRLHDRNIATHGSRDYERVIHLSKILMRLRVARMLFAFPNSIYYNEDIDIGNISKYMREFEKRAYVQFDDVISAVYLLLVQWLPPIKKDVIKFFSSKILRIKNHIGKDVIETPSEYGAFINKANKDVTCAKSSSSFTNEPTTYDPNYIEMEFPNQEAMITYIRESMTPTYDRGDVRQIVYTLKNTLVKPKYYYNQLTHDQYSLIQRTGTSPMVSNNSKQIPAIVTPEVDGRFKLNIAIELFREEKGRGIIEDIIQNEITYANFRERNMCVVNSDTSRLNYYNFTPSPEREALEIMVTDDKSQSSNPDAFKKAYGYVDWIREQNKEQLNDEKSFLEKHCNGEPLRITEDIDLYGLRIHCEKHKIPEDEMKALYREGLQFVNGNTTDDSE